MCHIGHGYYLPQWLLLQPYRIIYYHNKHINTKLRCYKRLPLLYFIITFSYPAVSYITVATMSLTFTLFVCFAIRSLRADCCCSCFAILSLRADCCCSPSSIVNTTRCLIVKRMSDDARRKLDHFTDCNHEELER